MKLSGWLLRISMVAMIALSLVFSWLIWQNPSRLGHQQAAVTVTRHTDADTTKNAGVVMAPTMAYYQHGGAKQLLFTPDDNVTTNIRTAMHNWRLGTVTSGGKLTAAEYAALLDGSDTLQLVYHDTMAYKTFNQSFFAKQATANNANFTFTRVLVNLDRHPNSLVFVNDANRTIHTGTLAKHSLTKLTTLVQQAALTSFAVSEKRLDNGRQIAHYTDAIAVQPYVFLLDQQSANHYVSLLMPTASTDSVDARELGADTVYTAGTDYRLTLDTDADTLQFDNATALSSDKRLASNLTKSYTALGALDLLGQSAMRYYSYNTASRKVTYRSFAQGLPIFNRDYYGRVTVATTTSGQQMFFSMNNLTVPIPTSQAKVTLPSTDTVLQHLHGVGYDDNAIEDIVLGYYWEKQDENSQVVKLTPAYFVEIDGQYRRYDKWQGPTADKQTLTGTQG